MLAHSASVVGLQLCLGENNGPAQADLQSCPRDLLDFDSSPDPENSLPRALCSTNGDLRRNRRK